MMWQLFYDFFFWLLDGSQWADFSADLLALGVSTLFIYFIAVIPIQFIIRSLIHLISAISNTQPFKTKWNRRKRGKFPINDE
jgi:hypothetical protein